MNIILQPCPRGDPERHFQDTIATPVDLGVIESFVPPSELRELEGFARGGAIMAWGLTPGVDGSSVTSWMRVSQGDLAAFFGDKRVFFVGRVCMRTRRPALADHLWGRDAKGQTWELMYFLDEGWSSDFPLGSLTTALGYASDLVMRARVRSATPQADGVLSQSQLQLDMDVAKDLDAILQTTDATVLQQRIKALDARLTSAPPELREKAVRQYERHAGIASLVKQRENYTCQLCGYVGFPKKSTNEPYCEVHHKIYAGSGGTSLSGNLVALCATCHRKAHYGDLSGDSKAKALGIA